MVIFSIVFFEAQELQEFLPECVILSEGEIIIRITFVLWKRRVKLTDLSGNLQEIFFGNLSLKNLREHFASLSEFFVQLLEIFQLKLFVNTGSQSRNSVSESFLLLLREFFTIFVHPTIQLLLPGSNFSFRFQLVFYGFGVFPSTLLLQVFSCIAII